MTDLNTHDGGADGALSTNPAASAAAHASVSGAIADLAQAQALIARALDRAAAAEADLRPAAMLAWLRAIEGEP